MTGRPPPEAEDPGGLPALVADLFAQALEQPAGERRAFLESRGSAAVRAQVISLLAAHERAGGFLEDLDAARSATLLEDAPAPDVAGRRVGPYRFLHELGRGGMGVVYLAERAEGGFRQQAAVKLVKRGMDSDAILQRFLQERQILAGLDHPGVARLLDGGADEDGRPYFAMEYVEGEPLTRHCDGRRLGIEDRLRLLEEAARAVQYAHGRLVVHRDLKPSNILVTPGGRVKLLDFGVAKMLADDPEMAVTALTMPGVRPMTLDYAAPEQVRGELVSTATDVYALGVVLYELLTGCRPCPARDGSAEALARAVCEDEPEPPSVAAERSPAAIAQARRLTPQRLARRLRGDLDTVVLKALAKLPLRRYASAEALADDLRRHLGGHPVEARRDTMAYRAAKFVRRHRVGVAAVSVAALGLLLGLLGTAWQADRARSEARRALAVQRFLVGVFEGADPTRSIGETLTARQLLDEGARRLRGEPAMDPSTRAELADTLARTYRSLGRLDDASAWSREAAGGFREALGGLHPRTALAELTEAEVREDRGDIATARKALDALLPRLREAYGESSSQHLRARTARASLLSHTGELEDALVEQREILAATERVPGVSVVEIAAQQGRVADALADLSRFEEAESVFRQALGRIASTGAERSPQAIYLETMLAELLDRAGRANQASALFRSALEKGRSQLGPRHPQVAQILIKYGFLLNMQGRYGDGEAALDEAISILEPLGHYDAAAALGYKGVALLRRERLQEAREAFARAEGLHRAKLGADNPMTWWAAMNLAYTDARLGVEAAEGRLREAIAALERLHGAESNDVRAPRKYLGEVLRMRGRYDEAEAMHRSALELERRLFGGEDTLASASTKHQIALDLLESGKPDRLDEARGLAGDSVAFFRAHPPESGRLGEVLTTAGRIAAAQGDLAYARSALGEARDLLSAARGEGAPSTRTARTALAALPR